MGVTIQCPTCRLLQMTCPEHLPDDAERAKMTVE